MSSPPALTVTYADGPAGARTGPRDALAAAGLADLAALADDPDDRVDVVLGWTLERHRWLDDPTLRISTMLAGYGVSRAVAAGRVTPLPVRLSAVPARLRSNPSDLAVIAGVRRGDGFAFRGSVGWGDVLAATARRVVVEVDDAAIDLGGPDIEGEIVATVDRPTGHAEVASSRPADDVDLAIGAHVASLVPDDATLQFGPGGVGEGIARAIGRPVRIRSGLCTDAMAGLHHRGLLAAPAVVAYTWGGEPIDRLHAAGMLTLTSVTETHDLTRLSSIPRFVACNTALQVGLDGSVNVERVGDRVVAAVGGHADFCAAASRSVGGLSIVAVRSTITSSGATTSTIVPAVDVVSTPRCDVDVVITEHGIADLRGLGDRARARRLIAIAAPEHRADLAR